MTIRRAMVWTAACCCAIQLASATWLVKHFVSPNAAMTIAPSLVTSGRYEGGYMEVLQGPYTNAAVKPRLFLLPGEVLYLTVVFRVLPEPLHRYAHVPVTTLFVLAVAYLAALAGGPLVGLATGLLASIQPFVVVHGPVWDDTFFAAAMVWAVVALLYEAVKRSRLPARPSRRQWGRLAAVTAFSAFACLLRGEPRGILVLLALAVIFLPSLRAARSRGVAILLGMTIALTSWGVRNKLAVGEFAVSTSHDGIAVYLSNGPHARQAVWYGQIDRNMNMETMGAHWKAVAGMTETEANRYYWRQATHYMITHPLDVFATSALKIAVTMGGIRPEDSLATRRNLAALIPNGILLALAVYWLYLVRSGSRIASDRQLCWLLGIVAFGVIGILAIGPIGWRYRITIDGVLWITGAWALVVLGSRLAGRPYTRA